MHNKYRLGIVELCYTVIYRVWFSNLFQLVYSGARSIYQESENGLKAIVQIWIGE